MRLPPAPLVPQLGPAREVLGASARAQLAVHCSAQWAWALGPCDSGKQEVLKIGHLDFPTSGWRDRETVFECQNYSIGLM